MANIDINTQGILTMKVDALFKRTTIAVIIVTALSAINDFTAGLNLIAYSNIIVCLLCVVSLRIHRRQMRNLSKYIVLTGSVIVLTFLVGSYPFEVGLYLFYFPLLVMAFSFLVDSARAHRAVAVAIIFILAVGSAFIDTAHLIPKLSLTDGLVFYAICFNFFVSFLMIWFYIDFLVSVNLESESKLQNLALEIDNKRKQLEQTNASLDRMIYSTSHDIRSPMASMKGLVNLARLENKAPDIDQYLKLMEDRIIKLQQFVTDTLDFTRVANELDKPEVVQISDLIDETLETLKYMDGFSRLNVLKRNKLAMPVIIDRKKISVVLSNLITNAIKYQDPDRQAPYIIVGSEYHDCNLLITVEDNGIGISEDNKEKIFSQFFRATSQSYGSGIGLNIVSYTLNRLNGQIHVESRMGVGSKFTVRVPCQSV